MWQLPVRWSALRSHKYAVLAGLLFVSAAVAGTFADLRSHAHVTLPNETAIHVSLNQTVSTDQSQPGDHFEATVSEPVTLGNKTVIPSGAGVEGLVVDAHPSGRLKGRARLQLALETVTVNGTTYEIHTSARTSIGGNHKNRNIALIGGGAGGGALIGAVAGGGKGALIGGPIGAGAGTAVAYLTGKKDVRLLPKTPLTFRLTEPLTIDSKA